MYLYIWLGKYLLIVYKKMTLTIKLKMTLNPNFLLDFF